MLRKNAPDILTTCKSTCWTPAIVAGGDWSMFSFPGSPAKEERHRNVSFAAWSVAHWINYSFFFSSAPIFVTAIISSNVFLTRSLHLPPRVRRRYPVYKNASMPRLWFNFRINVSHLGYLDILRGILWKHIYFYDLRIYVRVTLQRVISLFLLSKSCLMLTTHSVRVDAEAAGMFFFFRNADVTRSWWRIAGPAAGAPLNPNQSIIRYPLFQGGLWSTPAGEEMREL